MPRPVDRRTVGLLLLLLRSRGLGAAVAIVAAVWEILWLRWRRRGRRAVLSRGWWGMLHVQAVILRVVIVLSLLVFVILLVLIVLALRLAFERIVEIGTGIRTPGSRSSRTGIPARLHRAAKPLELLVFPRQAIDALLGLRPLFGHLEDVLVSGLLLAGQVEILLLQALSLLRHLLHLLAEGQEQVIAVVQCVFDLL